MQEELKFAVLIDADNVSFKYIKIILDEIANYGIATYKRIYGDWTDTRLSSWKPVLLDNSIIPVQQYSYTTGKSSTDSAMIIDAMDILYSGNVQGFCIVSSDSDFTRLVARLRESGMNVIGMGESKTPKPFIVACNQFKYLDILLANARKAEKMAVGHGADSQKPEKKEPEKKEQEPEKKEKEPEQEADQAREKEKEKDREKESKTRERGRNGSRQEAKSKGENKAEGKGEAKTEKDKEKEKEKDKSREKAAPEAQEEKAPQPRTNLEMVRQAIHSIVEDGSDEDGWMLSADLGNQLAKRFPDFDVRNFGFSKLTPFLASLKDFEIRRTRSSGNRNVQLVYVKEK